MKIQENLFDVCTLLILMTIEYLVGLGGGEFSVLYDTFDDYIIDMFQVGIDNLKI